MTKGSQGSVRAGRELSSRDPAARLVDRPRLLERLDRGVPLTVLRGARGAGKSTLVDQWLRSWGVDPHGRRPSADDEATPFRAVRVVVDRELTDADAFWTSLAEALADAGVDAHLPSGGPPRLRVARQLREVRTPLVVVIESVERLADDQIDADLVDLLARVPSLRLVVCSERRRPLETWARADAQAEVLDFATLRFDLDELTALLELRGVAEPSRRAIDLWDSFRGWPAPTVALVAERAGRAEAYQPVGDQDARTGGAPGG